MYISLYKNITIIDKSIGIQINLTLLSILRKIFRRLVLLNNLIKTESVIELNDNRRKMILSYHFIQKFLYNSHNHIQRLIYKILNDPFILRQEIRHTCVIYTEISFDSPKISIKIYVTYFLSDISIERKFNSFLIL